MRWRRGLDSGLHQNDEVGGAGDGERGLDLASAAGGCQGGEGQCDSCEAGAEEYLPDGEVEVIVFGQKGLHRSICYRLGRACGFGLYGIFGDLELLGGDGLAIASGVR